MKILFFILFFILFIVSVLICSSLFISIKYCGNILFKVRILFLSFKFPVPILYKSKTEKIETDTQKKEPQTKTKPEKKKKPKKEKEKLPFPGVKKTLVLLKDSIGIISNSFKGAFKLKKLHFKAVAASADAATTAELYGVLCTVGAALHQFASNAKGINNKNVYVEIIPDFLAETPDIYGDIKFSIRIFRILLLGKNAFSIYNAYKKLAQSVAKEALENTDASQNNSENSTK